MTRSLMRLWRLLPIWVHVLAAKLSQPHFRAGVGALIFDERCRVLLFKHTYRKFEWGIPGGALEHHEQPADAIRREFYEETGMQIEVGRLLKVLNAGKKDRFLSMIYLCRIIGGEFAPSHEISEMRYFDVNDLPRMLFTEKDLIRWAAGSLTADERR